MLNSYLEGQNEIIENICIEIISILKRFFNGLNNNSENFNKIANSNIIDHLCFLLQKDNLSILKLLHFILIPVIRESLLSRNIVIVQKFVKAYNVENIIQGIREKSNEICKILLDFVILLIENNEFRNLFMFLEGHQMLIK